MKIAPVITLLSLEKKKKKKLATNKENSSEMAKASFVLTHEQAFPGN